MRAGPPLLENIIQCLIKGKMNRYRPQSSFLSLISTGEKYAVASKGRYLALEGSYLWIIKDYIDRTWMQNYIDLPDMSKRNETQSNVPSSVSSKGADVMAAFAATAMRCGGCGAKVGATTVSRVLAEVYKRSKTSNNIDHDDAAIIPIDKNDEGGAMIHTIDFFRSFIDDPYLFGKVSAVHALSDCHAMGAVPRTALALAVVQYSAVEEITEKTLIAMLSGACDIFDEESCSLIGGHTCEGIEQALGFAIHGFFPNPNKLFRKQGGQVGDLVVITKPIGTGALFAANMRAKSSASHISEALQYMCQSNGRASQVAVDLNNMSNGECAIRACTDVTGFGLIGHLLEMLVANDEVTSHERIGCALRINDIPFLSGGIDASRNQIYSSLHRDNFRNRRAVTNHTDAAKNSSILYPLLFDPQTAGGLLFFVNPLFSNQFIKALKENGSPVSSVIGEIVAFQADEYILDNDLCVIGGSRTGQRITIDYTTTMK